MQSGLVLVLFFFT